MDKRYRRKEGAWHEEVPDGSAPRHCVRLEPVADEALAGALEAAAAVCAGELIDVAVADGTATVRCKAGGILSVAAVAI